MVCECIYFIKKISCSFLRPGSVSVCVLMIISCCFNGGITLNSSFIKILKAIFAVPTMFWLGGIPLALITFIICGLLSYFTIYLMVKLNY